MKKPETFRYYKPTCALSPYTKKQVRKPDVVRGFGEDDKILVVGVEQSKYNGAASAEDFALEIVAPGGLCYIDSDPQMRHLTLLPVEDMNEIEPPELGKLYRVKAFNILFKNQELTKSYPYQGSADRLLPDRDNHIMIVSAEKAFAGTIRQHWLLKIIAGENIGWLATSRNWTNDFEPVRHLHQSKPVINLIQESLKF